MSRKSSDAGVALIGYAIGLVVMLIAGVFMFLGNVAKYNLWKKFWITSIPLGIVSITGYYFYSAYPDVMLFVLLTAWIVYIVYWACVIGDKNLTERKEITSQTGVTTPNCPYCGYALAKFPQRKTKCKYCGNYIYVRTRPSDKQKILVKEENIEVIEEQIGRKKSKGQVPVIDASKEMQEIINYFTSNYKELCTYETILNIEENDRLEIMRYMWENWNYRIKNKVLKERFPKYDIEVLSAIQSMETGRIYTYYHRNEIINRTAEDNPKPLIKISGINEPVGEKLCTIEDIINVYNWSIKNDEPIVNFIEKRWFDDFPDCRVYLFQDDDFREFTPHELKKFCKDRRLKYPY